MTVMEALDILYDIRDIYRELDTENPDNRTEYVLNRLLDYKISASAQIEAMEVLVAEIVKATTESNTEQLLDIYKAVFTLPRFRKMYQTS